MRGEDDIRLELKTRDGRNTYRIGEVVPVDLWFSSTVESKYSISSATPDRSGRGSEDEFLVEPRSGWQDLLDLYFRSGTWLYRRNDRYPVAFPRPVAVRLDLNEWIRFEVPGDYTVSVRSHRGHSIIVTSNTLALTIVPATAEWQHSTLEQAVDTLTRLKCWDLAYAPATECGETIWTLRFLGTDDAAREMALHAGNLCYSMGLAGSPARSRAALG